MEWLSWNKGGQKMLESILAIVFGMGGAVALASSAALLGCILIAISILCALMREPHPL